MLNFPARFAAMARAFPGVWIDAEAVWTGNPTFDEGGSIIEPGVEDRMAVSVQFDAVTREMRSDADFKDKDMLLLILTDGLRRPIDDEAMINVSSGPHAGNWSIRSSRTDPAGIGWECRGRPWR